MAYKRGQIRFVRFLMQRTVRLVLLSLSAFFSSLALLTFHHTDPSWLFYTTESVVIKNLFGSWGAHGASALMYVFGYASALIPLLCVAAFWYTWEYKTIKEEWDRVSASLCLLPIVSGLCHFFGWGALGYFIPGGRLGQIVYYTFRVHLDKIPTAIVLASLLFVCAVILSRESFVAVMHAVWALLRRAYFYCYRSALPALRAGESFLHAVGARVRFLLARILNTLHPIDPKNSHSERLLESSTDQSHPAAHTAQKFNQDNFWDTYFETQSPTVQAVPSGLPHAMEVPSPSNQPIKPFVVPHMTEQPVIKKPYKIPTLDLLAPSVKESGYINAENHRSMSQALEEKLSRFGVSGKVVSVRPGPVITLFEYEPDIDAKVSKILSLSDDLALALEAMSVRIIAPIPGTSRVGFEVSNKERKAVYLRDILRAQSFQKTKAIMPIVLGKDTAGDDVVVDMVDMPHLLVAGSTGSGKSVALNTLLISLLYKLTPEQLQLVIIDPKRLEFASYHDIPHLLFPIITDGLRAAPVLHWLVRTMEKRYEQMAQAGARSIVEYNQLCTKQGVPTLPYIVLIIDELADLMMVARKEIEDNIARLAQMARAAGIHLIVATQRPSVDVLTGVIKVNFSSRMSFRVTSKVDSRTVLDALGAEALLGKGDMLFLDAHSARMRRIHGAYVTDAEITALADHVRAQRAATYINLEDTVAAYNQQSDDGEEPLLKEVVAYLDTIDEVSISLLQRRFKIGYNRSARIFEILEAQGKILPSSGGKTRKVIR